MTDKETYNLLSEEDLMEIKILADNDMNCAKTAAAMYVHRNTLIYRLTMIRRKVGLDPRRFWELRELIRIIDKYEGG